MISTNEELQSTNEELQSLNEELHTVSAEHQVKIKELIELNDDLNNYFRNTDIGQILLDKKLMIRKFSPASKRQINLIESDVGRSIIDISTNFTSGDFINEIKRVIKTGTASQKEVSTHDGGIFLMKINPYIRVDKSIDGVVISFVDLSEVKKLNSIIEGVFNSSSNAIIAQQAIRDGQNQIIDFEYTAANVTAERMLGVTAAHFNGKRLLADAGIYAENFEIYNPNTGEIKKATKKECEGLECTAVWTANHLESRIEDHFAGKENVWVERLKIK